MAITEPESNDKKLVVGYVHTYTHTLQYCKHAIPFTLTVTLPHACRQVAAAIGHSVAAAGDADATLS